MSGPVFPGPGLDPAQWEHIKALAQSVTQRQALWLSGYFAGLEETRGFAESPSPLVEDAGGPAPAAQAGAPARGR